MENGRLLEKLPLLERAIEHIKANNLSKAKE